MEARTSQNPFFIALLGLSVVITGCSRQLYTSLVGSEGEAQPVLARGATSSSTDGEGRVSKPSALLSSDLSMGGAFSHIVESDIPVEPPPLPTFREEDTEPALAQAGRIPYDVNGEFPSHPSRSADSQPLQADLLHPEDASELSAFSGGERDAAFRHEKDDEDGLSFQNELGSMASEDQATESLPFASTSSPSFSDEISPLADEDLLTEMAAASGTSGSAGGELDAVSGRGNGTPLTPLENELSGQGNLVDIFFDFDAAAIRSDAASILQANAQILKARINDSHVVIEGHCDERGTVEYNLVLGERRARSTMQYLVDLGVSPEVIRTISYGKEKPFCLASDPACWQLNRRGHFVVQ